MLPGCLLYAEAWLGNSFDAQACDREQAAAENALAREPRQRRLHHRTISECDLVGSLQFQDGARLAGRGDLEPQPFYDLAGHCDLFGIRFGEPAAPRPEAVLEPDADVAAERGGLGRNA